MFLRSVEMAGQMELDGEERAQTETSDPPGKGEGPVDERASKWTRQAGGKGPSRHDGWSTWQMQNKRHSDGTKEAQHEQVAQSDRKLQQLVTVLTQTDEAKMGRCKAAGWRG